MKNTSINELNALLKGEYMAVDGYERYIRKVEDPNVKNELQKIQQEHKNHAIKIAQRIQDLGGKPAAGVGIAGKTAEVVSAVKDIGLKGTTSILVDAYNGEDKGIKMATEVVKGDLDSQSAAMVKEMLDDDRTHLTTLNSLINTSGKI